MILKSIITVSDPLSWGLDQINDLSFFYLRLVLRILVASGRWRHVGGLAIHLRRKSIVEGRAVALRLAIDRRSVVRGLLSAGFVVRRRSAWHLGPALMRGLVWCS